LVSTTAQVISLYNGKNVIRILDQISSLDNEFDEARIKYYSPCKMFVILIIFTLISFVTPVVFSIMAINTHSMENTLTLMYNGTVYFVGNFIIWLADLQFTLFITLLRYHFSLLNDSILNLTAASLYITTSNQTLEPSDIACNTSSGRSATASSYPFNSVATIQSTTLRLCRQHSSLCDISEFVNRKYSLHLIQFVGLTLFEVVCGLYTFIVGLLQPGFSIYFSSYKYYATYWVIWIFMLSAKVVFLSATCNYTSREVRHLQSISWQYLLFVVQSITEIIIYSYIYTNRIISHNLCEHFFLELLKPIC
jgi:hypothetical protein